ncbi:DUF4321 domain-containing protein [Clostridium sp. SYSU_GA19001]|uniref:DUF4321 domain-containing protein n=1 Tax=Clostridium caldaquaticum TaxID=2940653 RepID=UPI00207769EE|nr:DUF4321 domain-containing protein [Clostridium caldaquaticum]MCM8710362.1 DUF4321 domain-containing protein [Clostridium caldaquaticum]
MKGLDKSKGFFIFTVFLGAIGGSLLGDMLGTNIKFLHALKSVYSIGTSKPITLDLKVLSLSFGLNYNVNLMSIFGIVLAIILYRKA